MWKAADGLAQSRTMSSQPTLPPSESSTTRKLLWGGRKGTHLLVLMQTSGIRRVRHLVEIWPDKSSSRLMSAAHLIYTALLVESQSVAIPKAPSKKCGGIALAGIDREYRRGLERCRSIPQSHSEVTFQYQRSMPLENWIGPVPSYVISGRLRASNAYARKNSFPSFARTAN